MVKQGEELLPEAGREEATPPGFPLPVSDCLPGPLLAEPAGSQPADAGQPVRQGSRDRGGQRMSPRATRQKVDEAFYSGSLHSVSARLCFSSAASSFHRSQAAETYLKRKGASVCLMANSSSETQVRLDPGTQTQEAGSRSDLVSSQPCFPLCGFHFQGEPDGGCRPETLLLRHLGGRGASVNSSN